MLADVYFYAAIFDWLLWLPSRISFSNWRTLKFVLLNVIINCIVAIVDNLKKENQSERWPKILQILDQSEPDLNGVTLKSLGFKSVISFPLFHITDANLCCLVGDTMLFTSISRPFLRMIGSKWTWSWLAGDRWLRGVPGHLGVLLRVAG